MNELRRLREQAGMSLEELAERSDVELEALDMLENGAVKAEQAVIDRLANAFDGALFGQGIRVTPEDLAELVAEEEFVEAAKAENTLNQPISEE